LRTCVPIKFLFVQLSMNVSCYDLQSVWTINAIKTFSNIKNLKDARGRSHKTILDKIYSRLFVS